MKISKILELLLILIIIAFAASKPFQKHHGSIARQNPNTDAETETYDENDEDDDDFFGLDAEDLDDDDEDRIGNSTTVQDQDNLDDSDGFLLFGDDFLAVFDDDENETKPTKKQKSKIQSAAIEIPQTISTFVTQTNVDSINSNSQLIPIETVQTVVNQLTQKNDELMTNNDKPSGSQLNLQHTSALLELVQSSNAANHNLTEDNSLKLEGDNFLNSTLNDGDKTPTIDDKNVIAVPLSDVEQEMLQETLNKVKQQQQSLISTTTVPSKKISTTAKPSTGFLGIVEDLIEDDDEEEVPEEDDDDDDDNDEEERPVEGEKEEDEEDSEDSEEVTKKPSKTTTTTTVKPSKTKRPTNFIDVIGDTLGL